MLARWDNDLLTALRMEPRNEHELKWYHFALGDKKAATETEVLMGSGLYRQIVASTDESKTNNVNLGKWRKFLDGNFLTIANGPSGSSEEYAQLGDFFDLTSDPYWGCNLRNAMFATMIAQAHHSFEEIVQGFENDGTSTKRAAALSSKAGLPDNADDDPFDTLKECGKVKSAQITVTPIKWKWPSHTNPPAFASASGGVNVVPPENGDIYAETVKVFKELNDAPTGPLATALLKTPKYAVTNTYQTQAVSPETMGTKLAYTIAENQINHICNVKLGGLSAAWKAILESNECKVGK